MDRIGPGRHVPDSGMNNPGYSIWRLNVTVDQALAPDYVPPSTYADPRLQLVLDQGDPTAHHTWSPDGSRLAYRCSMAQPDGTRRLVVRLKGLMDGSDQVLGEWISDVSTGFMWGPSGDRIVAGNGLGDVWAFHADTPGLRTLLAPARTYKSGKDTITEEARYPRFRPDGGVIGISYYKSVTNKSGTPVYRSPAIMAPTGWPAKALLSSSIVNESIPLGWTP
ncbi:hypothetical protein V5E97_01080 [Singulisphaera sp. Ch08]|uniref:Uncharacterized protein n=1 Tax=Singulisphaera sp. Ch08 TaxID=3120278 RepID=A0AAU7CHJ9_9BACT